MARARSSSSPVRRRSPGDGQLVGEGDFEAQTRQVFENLRTVLEQAGAALDAIVKLTVFLTDMSKLRDYTRIKGEFMSGDQPASSAVGVTALARPEMMVEVEAIAVLRAAKRQRRARRRRPSSHPHRRAALTRLAAAATSSVDK